MTEYKASIRGKGKIYNAVHVGIRARVEHLFVELNKHKIVSGMFNRGPKLEF